MNCLGDRGRYYHYPILQVRKLSHRETQSESQEMNLGSLAVEAILKLTRYGLLSGCSKPSLSLLSPKYGEVSSLSCGMVSSVSLNLLFLARDPKTNELK